MLRAYYEQQGLDEGDIFQRIEGDLKEVPDPYLCGRTPRHAMETLGTEWGRMQMHEDFWINAWRGRVNNMRREYDIVTDDCRFPNEALKVREVGGEIVKIVPKTRRRGKSNHVAEKGLPNTMVDHVINNDEGIGKLREEVDQILYGGTKK